MINKKNYYSNIKNPKTLGLRVPFTEISRHGRHRSTGTQLKTR